MNPKKLPQILIITFILGLTLGGGGVYLVTKGNVDSSHVGEGTFVHEDIDISKIKEFKASTEESNNNNNDGVLYRSNQYGFSLHYPKGLIFKEFDEGQGGQTIVFQKPGDTKLGFQIYITPYTADTITGARILQDIPSGDVQGLKEEQLTEDLLVATFISTDPFLGETKEIWFIDGKYLYQATTFANLDQLLTEVVKSWKFDD